MTNYTSLSYSHEENEHLSKIHIELVYSSPVIECSVRINIFFKYSM